MARKKTYMTEADIQRIEHWDASQIASVFFKDGIQHAGEQFVLLLRSYRIAANVAVSAWKLVEELQQTSQISAATLEELTKRLHFFAPQAAAFKPPAPLREYTCRLFEELYDHLSQWDAPTFNTSIMLEQLFRRIEELRIELTKGTADG